jgi:hypothetical protein
MAVGAVSVVSAHRIPLTPAVDDRLGALSGPASRLFAILSRPALHSREGRVR